MASRIDPVYINNTHAVVKQSPFFIIYERGTGKWDFTITGYELHSAKKFIHFIVEHREDMGLPVILYPRQIQD